MVIERPETVTIGFSTPVNGVTSTGKRWTRWQRGDRITFSVRRSRSGRRALHVYRYQRRQTQVMFGNRTATVHELVPPTYRPLMAEAIARLWRRNIGEVPEVLMGAPLTELTVGLAFPALAGRPLPPLSGYTQPVVPTGLTHAWREDTARGIAEQLFGKRALRKDLIRASATAEPMRGGVAHAVRGLVPVDHLVEYLTQPDGRAEHWDRRALRQLFTIIAPSARRRLLLQTRVTDDAVNGWGMSSDNITITDALRCIRDLIEVYGADESWVTDEVRKPKSWRTLHDAVSRLLRRAEAPNVSIPQTLHARALSGLETGAGTLRAARQTDELFGWAEAMDNCIAGYAREAVDGDTTLFGLYRSGVLTANLEVAPDGQIVQLFGRFNQELPGDEDRSVRDAVTDLLVRYGLAAEPTAMAA
jgi:hypothetical protein